MGTDGTETPVGGVSDVDEAVEVVEVVEVVEGCDGALVVVVDGAGVVVEVPPARFEPPGAGAAPLFPGRVPGPERGSVGMVTGMVDVVTVPATQIESYWAAERGGGSTGFPVPGF